MGLQAIRSRYLLLCEGQHDSEFFQYLVRARGLQPHFEICSCGYIAGVRNPLHGISHLTDALNALPAIVGFNDKLEAILIVADNDSHAVNSFAAVQSLISATAEISPGKRYGVPCAPLQKEGSEPAIVVMMIPWTGIAGALDTLCYDAATFKRPLVAAAVEEFAKSVGVDEAHGWAITKQHKMKLRSLIAAAHKQDPYISPTYLWSKGTDVVPLDSNIFDDITNFLSDFPGFLTTQQA